MMREIKECELDQLLDLYTHLHDTDLPYPETNEVEKVWSEILTDEKIHYFVIEDNGTLVCCCHLVVVPNLTRGASSYAIIENVVTRREYRRKGYGQRLLSNVLNWAWKQRCYKVMLMTGRKDTEVTDFYRSAGFDDKAKTAFIVKNPGF